MVPGNDATLGSSPCFSVGALSPVFDEHPAKASNAMTIRPGQNAGRRARAFMEHQYTPVAPSAWILWHIAI